ncbi:alpha/beta fold hydrolase [Micromonospora sp. NPDC050417]|uniref:alpha/beta fold hydrolase n=1 Tax=Micromonospora sp. NPDC050417 TaxID=3364280 RepID=UPI00378A3114
MPVVEVNGAEIAYRESSGEGRPVVLVHGNSSSSRTWGHLLDTSMGQRFRCLALDLPGHGGSATASTFDDYSVPAYAAILAGFVRAVNAEGAVLVGWSLGGHIALESTPLLGDAVAGVAIFGTPPIATAESFGSAFLPNPVVNIGFAAESSADAAREYAENSVARDSSVPLEPFVEDFLATDGAARAGLAASLATGRFADEVAIITGLRQPLAVLHGRADRFVSLPYVQGLAAPTLWRGAVQIIDEAGHAPHVETPTAFTNLLEQFIADLP